MKAADFQDALRNACEVAMRRDKNGVLRSPDLQIHLFLGVLRDNLVRIDPTLAAQVDLVGRPREAV